MAPSNRFNQPVRIGARRFKQDHASCRVRRIESDDVAGFVAFTFTCARSNPAGRRHNDNSGTRCSRRLEGIANDMVFYALR